MAYGYYSSSNTPNLWAVAYAQMQLGTSLPREVLPFLRTAFGVGSPNTVGEFFSLMNDKSQFTAPTCAKADITVLLGILGAHCPDVGVVLQLKETAERFLGTDVSAQYNAVVERKVTANASVNVFVNTAPAVDNATVIKPSFGGKKLTAVSTFIDEDSHFVVCVKKTDKFEFDVPISVDMAIYPTLKRAQKAANEAFNTDYLALVKLDPKAQESDVPHEYVVSKLTDIIGAKMQAVKPRSIAIRKKNETDE